MMKNPLVRKPVKEPGEGPALKILKEGKVLLDYGPVTMVIEARKKGSPDRRAAVAAARQAVLLLKEAASWLPVVRVPSGQVDLRPVYPPVVNAMIAAVKATGDPQLTPLAAVAGAIAGFCARKAREEGADWVTVNNGGDLALVVPPGERIRVGVWEDLTRTGISHVIEVTSQSGIAGIATSGFGGRSFTLGVASAATVLAGTPGIADACATVLGNAVNVDHPAIVRVPAASIDPETDIPGLLVTKEIGYLPPEAVAAALQNGLAKARELHEKGLILGAVISLRGRSVFYPSGMAALFGGAGGKYYKEESRCKFVKL
ncbi:MAG: UPF0280 family protein [Armatimonadetes bacterium]|nr:UPF0280 family protein [Armatimonadota bacterium]